MRNVANNVINRFSRHRETATFDFPRGKTLTHEAERDTADSNAVSNKLYVSIYMIYMIRMYTRRRG